MGKNSTEARESLLATAPLACNALKHGNLMHWEFGNEPDLFSTTHPYSVRPANWSEQDYVDNWLSGTEMIKRAMARSCPEMVSDEMYKYIAPSFAGIGNSLDSVKTWEDGLDSDKNIALNSMHK